MKNKKYTGREGETNQGFTLIEMLVVLSVFTLLVTITLPYISAWYSPVKLRGAQRELISNLRFTQQNAVTSQRNHLIRFFKAGNYYNIIKKEGGEQILKTVFLPVGITFSVINLAPLPSEVEFNSAAAPNSTGEITLINNKGETKKVEVTPSGFVKGD